MSEPGLFGELPEAVSGKVDWLGNARMRSPMRDQIEWQFVDIDGLIGSEHPARVIWAYVEKLDLSELEEAIKAREHVRGQAPASPTAIAGAVALRDQPEGR